MMSHDKRKDIQVHTLRTKQKTDAKILAMTITLAITLATTTTAAVIPTAFASDSPLVFCFWRPATIIGTQGNDNMLGLPVTMLLWVLEATIE